MYGACVHQLIKLMFVSDGGGVLAHTHRFSPAYMANKLVATHINVTVAVSFCCNQRPNQP